MVRASIAALAVQFLVCTVQNEPMPFYYSALPWSVGDGDFSYFVGACLGNVVVLSLFAGSQLLLALGFQTMYPPMTWVEALSIVRFPSLLSVPLMIWQQSTMAAGVTVVAFGEPAYVAVGVMAIVWSIYYYILRKGSLQCAYLDDRGERHNCLVVSLYGRGTWHDVDVGSKFKQRYRLFFGDYLYMGRMFILVDMTMNLSCGVLQGQPAEHTTHRDRPNAPIWLFKGRKASPT